MTDRNHRHRPVAAAGYLKDRHGIPIAVSTLNKLRCVGGGPQFCKFGRAVLYDEAWLDEWAAARVSAPQRNTAGSGESEAA